MKNQKFLLDPQEYPERKAACGDLAASNLQEKNKQTNKQTNDANLLCLTQPFKPQY